MAGRRVFGLFMLILIVVAVLLIIWYLGSQKTVYSGAFPMVW